MKRRGQTTAVSLFAFQDVMAGVIGIVFFAFLMLALNVVEAAATAQEPQPEVALERLHIDLAAKQEERDELADQVDAALAKLNAMTTFDARRIELEIEKLHARIAAAEADIEEAIQDCSATDVAIAAVTAERDALASDLAEKEDELQGETDRKRELAEKAKALEGDLTAERANIAYIRGSGVRKRPWLVEVTGREINVGLVDKPHAVSRFVGGYSSQRITDFLNWAEGLSPYSNYFVLIVKPSGFPTSLEIHRRLASKRFEIGKDYQPEATRPFDRE